MKFIIQLLILSLPILANAQLERTWLAVDSRKIATDYISIEGTIFDFSENTLTMKHVFSDSITSVDYTFSENSIFIKDSLFAKVKFLSKDSLSLEFFNKWMLHLFYPLETIDPTPKLTQSELTGSTWDLDFGDYRERWNFTDILWRTFATDGAKVAVQQETEIWNLTVFKDFVLLTLTMGQFDAFTYQVVDIENDTVRLKPINKWLVEDVDFIKTPSLTGDKLFKIKENLTSRTWKTKEIIESRSSAQAMIELMSDEIDSADLDLYRFTGSYAAWMDTVLISERQLNDKLISYEFGDTGNYCILVANEKYSCGTWELLKDGQTIKLDKGTGVEDYIEIVNVTPDQLVISNSNKFSIELGSNDYNVIYYKVKLE